MKKLVFVFLLFLTACGGGSEFDEEDRDAGTQPVICSNNPEACK